MFSGFTHRVLPVNGIHIHAVVGGSGYPLLLLHGNPQTYVMWHKVAQQLARHFTVVAADLRGYGDSDKPEGAADHSNYTKRVMADDQVELMRALGFERFLVMGHDRGARVAYRMALDHPEVVEKLILLDIVPTVTMYEKGDMEFCRCLFHWFFLTQERPFSEHMIQGCLEEYLENALHIGRYHSSNDTPQTAFSPEAYQEYLRCFRQPETIHGICEDYRAGAFLDVEIDRQTLREGRKIVCDTMVLWGKNGLVDRFFEPMKIWPDFAERVTGDTVPCGHFIPEEAPEALLEKIEPFLATHADAAEQPASGTV